MWLRPCCALADPYNSCSFHGVLWAGDIIMLLRVLLVLAGYLLACVAFALALVAFVFTPAELASADAGRFSMAGFQLLASSIQVIIFAALPALIVSAIAEWRAIDDWIYYALAAMLIAGVGFLAQYASELQGAPTIVNTYALTAFMTGGFVAGVVYWLITGRGAGRWGRTAKSADSSAAAKTT